MLFFIPLFTKAGKQLHAAPQNVDSKSTHSWRTIATKAVLEIMSKPLYVCSYTSGIHTLYVKITKLPVYYYSYIS